MAKGVVGAILLVVSAAGANVGGRFYSHSIAGLSLSNGSTIKVARTRIHCVDTICRFRTVYRTNAPGREFVGKFYGVRLDSLEVDDARLLQADALKADPDSSEVKVLGESFVFDAFPNRYQYTSIPIRAKIGRDSTFTVGGRLLPRAALRWGLGAFRGMTDIRHPLINLTNPHDNDYAIAYCFAPIHSFQGLDTVEATFTTTGATLVDKRFVYPEKSGRGTVDGDMEGRSVFVDSIPLAIEYRFRRGRGGSFQDPSVFSVGGPLVFLGSRKGRFHAEMGWEVGFNASFLSILPSANASFGTEGYRDFNWGLRFMTMGWSAGVLQRDFRQWEGTIGGSLGVIGFEIRTNGGFLHLSL